MTQHDEQVSPVTAGSEEQLAAELHGIQLLHDLATRLVSEEDVHVIYDQILAAAITLTDAEAGTVQILDKNTEELVMLASRGLTTEMAAHFNRLDARSDTSCGVALATGRRTFIDFDDPSCNDPEGSLRMHVEQGLLCAQSTPLVTRSGKPIGMVSTHWRSHHQPNEREMRFLDLLARQAADLIELRQTQEEWRGLNEELEERVRERTRELAEANVSLQSEVTERRLGEQRIKNLLRQVVNAQEEERRTIARELHDTLGQQLAALHVNIEILKTKTESDASVHEDIARMRKTFDSLNSNIEFLAWELRPASLDLLGLDAALQTYVGDWSQQFGINAIYHIAGMEGVRLAPEVETNLYRIFQEVLQNVHKHAQADRVNVLLERLDGQAMLIVEDNGKGYDADEVIKDGKGMGVVNMKERAELVGGSLEVESQPGAGTTVFVRVPVSASVIMEEE